MLTDEAIEQMGKNIAHTIDGMDCQRLKGPRVVGEMKLTVVERFDNCIAVSYRDWHGYIVDDSERMRCMKKSLEKEKMLGLCSGTTDKASYVLARTK